MRIGFIGLGNMGGPMALNLSHMIPDVVFKGEFDTVRFALKLARKDVGLATALAREYDVPMPMPMAAVGEQILIEAMARVKVRSST